MRTYTAALAATMLCGIAGPASAHGEKESTSRRFDPRHVEQTDFGRAGDPKTASRTMTIRMGDTMRYRPSSLTIRHGETVRFIVRNDGKTLHELVLGTPQELRKHAELMRKMPDMEHDEPHMVHVKPGRSETLYWTFNRPGEFQFACLIPGHYESGMVGMIIVE